MRYFRTNRFLCPIKNLSSYLKHRLRRFPALNPKISPLFIMPNGKALSRTELVKRLREVVGAIHLNPAHYSGHSFRIGAASSAAKMGLPAYLIQIFGRWSSSPYQRYIHMPSSTLARALSSFESSSS